MKQKPGFLLLLVLALSQFAHLCGGMRGATLVPVPSQNDARTPKPHLALERSELSSLHSRPGCRWAKAGPWWSRLRSGLDISDQPLTSCPLAEAHFEGAPLEMPVPCPAGAEARAPFVPGTREQQRRRLVFPIPC